MLSIDDLTSNKDFTVAGRKRREEDGDVACLSHRELSGSTW